jgi:hypothetical protein
MKRAIATSRLLMLASRERLHRRRHPAALDRFSEKKKAFGSEKCRQRGINGALRLGSEARRGSAMAATDPGFCRDD